jgi:hypothetical protein
MEKEVKYKNVIVFDGAMGHDWPALFADLALPDLPDGSRMRIVQTSFFDSEVTVFGDAAGAQLACKPVRDTLGIGRNREVVLTVRPDFVLLRNQPRGPTPSSDKRNVLYGLICANVPAINSLMSEYCNLERPLMLGVLREIRDRVGQDKFPLNEVTYHSSASSMIISPSMPCVLKLSHAHAGMG